MNHFTKKNLFALLAGVCFLFALCAGLLFVSGERPALYAVQRQCGI